ncbi:dehydrogenase [Amylostereum chailletii]|nr:dehydrogenase [Amylostereum chailletii]
MPLADNQSNSFVYAIWSGAHILFLASASARQKAIVSDKHGSISLRDTAMPKPRPDQILVKVIAVAQNPSDWMSAQKGRLEGAIVGCDFSGIVQYIGPEVPVGLRTIGERVAGFVHGGSKNGSFAEYLTTAGDFVVHVPDDWTYEDASQLGLAPYTALQALYESLDGLPLPLSTEAKANTEPLLVYGGSSSVGLFAIQFAKLAGFQVIATCSKKNFDTVQSFGADEVFDHNDPYMVKRIKEATNGQLKLAVDCISQASTPQLVSDSLSDAGGHIASLLPYDSPREGVKVNFNLIYEWIGESFEHPWPHVGSFQQKERGRKFTVLLSDLLKTGQLRPNPIRIFSDGLASVAEGFELMLAGKASITMNYAVSRRMTLSRYCRLVARSWYTAFATPLQPRY